MAHIDPQWFPFYTGIFTPTGRQHSHEWRQFDRLKANKIIRDTGITFYLPDLSPYSGYIDEDVEVEYFDGPITWTGIFETTLGLYRDWKLTVVLRDSVAHLPSSYFNDTGPDVVAMIKLLIISINT